MIPLLLRIVFQLAATRFLSPFYPPLLYSGLDIAPLPPPPYPGALEVVYKVWGTDPSFRTYVFFSEISTPQFLMPFLRYPLLRSLTLYSSFSYFRVRFLPQSAYLDAKSADSERGHS